MFGFAIIKPVVCYMSLLLLLLIVLVCGLDIGITGMRLGGKTRNFNPMAACRVITFLVSLTVQDKKEKSMVL